MTKPDLPILIDTTITLSHGKDSDQVKFELTTDNYLWITVYQTWIDDDTPITQTAILLSSKQLAALKEWLNTTPDVETTDES